MVMEQIPFICSVWSVFRPLNIYIYIYSIVLVFSFPSWGRSSPIHIHTLLLFILFFNCLPKFSTCIQELIHLAGLGHHGFFSNQTRQAHNQSAYGLPLWVMSCSSLSMFQHLWRNWGEDVCGRTYAWVLYVDMALPESNSFWDILKCDTSFAVCIWWFWGCLIYIVRKLMLVSVHFFQACSVFFCVWDTLYLQCWRWIESRNQKDECDLVKLTWPCLTFSWETFLGLCWNAHCFGPKSLTSKFPITFCDRMHARERED